MSEFQGTDIYKNYFVGNGLKEKPHTNLNAEIPRDEEILGRITKDSASVDTVRTLRADGNIDIEGFTDKVKYLLNEVWGDGWGDFTMESPTGKDPDKTPLPVISFGVVYREPSKGKIGLKGRPTELYLDPENNDYTIILNRKWFDCQIEFVFFHNSNLDARRLMQKFELFMDTYVGYFKEAGISELIFQEEVDSRLSSKYKDGLPSTCLHYTMVLERIVVDKIKTTKELRTKIQSKQSSS
jgi:hypothetical protein